MAALTLISCAAVALIALIPAAAEANVESPLNVMSAAVKLVFTVAISVTGPTCVLCAAVTPPTTMLPVVEPPRTSAPEWILERTAASTVMFSARSFKPIVWPAEA